MPIEISAQQLSPKIEAIPIRFIVGKYRFEMAFSAGEEVTLQVQYRQHAPVKNAKYILTTTQPWKHPLSHGMYRLFPENVHIVSSNYTLQANESGIFSFQQKDFMPQYDWHFSWEVH